MKNKFNSFRSDPLKGDVTPPEEPNSTAGEEGVVEASSTVGEENVVETSGTVEDGLSAEELAVEKELAEMIAAEEAAAAEAKIIVEEPVVDKNQNGSDSLGFFKVTSVRAHVFIKKDLHSRPITAVARGNMLPYFEEDLEDGWYEVQVLNRHQEKVLGFIEAVRGKVISQ